MKINLFKILIITFLTFVFAACHPVVTSNKVEQRVIFPSYSVHYDATEQTLTAQVTFQTDNESGEFIKLSGESDVLCNQDAMKQMSDDDKPCYYFYERTEMTDCPEVVNFSYVNNEGNEFHNRLKIRIIQISDMTLSKTQDTPFGYKGTAIDEDETITLVLKKDKQQYELQPEVADNNMLIVPATMLRDVKAGTYEAYLLRTTYSTSVKAMDRGGSAETSYHSKSYKITVQ
ncbi:MAG: hypothetical protein J5644_08905 [Bacteroidales bacterium]|nr:hypothetical protein [Bacteroidales bacterium]